MTITRERLAALREDAEASSPDPYAAIVNGPELIELLDELDEAEANYRSLLAQNDQILLRNKNLKRALDGTENEA